MGKEPDDKPRQLANFVDNEHVTPKSDKSGASTDEKPKGAHLFKSGAEWRGNALGRPKGIKQKLANDFIQALADDFDKHGKAAIVTVREQDPAKYLDVVCKLVPKDVDLNVNANDAFVKLWEMVASGTLAAVVDKLDNENEGARH